MRLIDADVLIQYLKTLQAINSGDVLFCEDLEDFIDHIEELPTVFDIEKVVEQLEKFKELECGDTNEDIELYELGRSQGKLEAYLNAIEIVKDGAE